MKLHDTLSELDTKEGGDEYVASDTAGSRDVCHGQRH